MSVQPTAMFALCHGAAGNAELFIEAGEVLGDPGYTAIAEAIGRQGIERYHEPRRPWPSGLTAGGDTPGLMLGLAGIGYFYLRLAIPAIPSILLLRREAFAQCGVPPRSGLVGSTHLVGSPRIDRSLG